MVRVALKRQHVPMNRHVSTHKMICWQILNKCNRACSFCISNSSPARALRAVDRIRILERLCELGVKKISISGGEPLLLERELATLVAHGYSLGLEMQITTNGDVLVRKLPRWAVTTRALINFSFYGGEDLHAAIMGVRHYEDLMSFARVHHERLSMGANYLLTNETFYSVEEFVADAAANRFDRVLFIAQMPMHKDLPPTLTDVDNKIAWISSWLLKGKQKQFKQGVRFHDYRYEHFFPVCGELGDLFILDGAVDSRINVGSIFEKELFINGKMVDVKDGLNILWEKRLVTSGIRVLG